MRKGVQNSTGSLVLQCFKHLDCIDCPPDKTQTSDLEISSQTNVNPIYVVKINSHKKENLSIYLDSKNTPDLTAKFSLLNDPVDYWITLKNEFLLPKFPNKCLNIFYWNCLYTGKKKLRFKHKGK